MRGRLGVLEGVTRERRVGGLGRAVVELVEEAAAGVGVGVGGRLEVGAVGVTGAGLGRHQRVVEVVAEVGRRQVGVAVEVEIDGNLATHHIYSFKELEALQKGGVQRIYTGNVPTGEHQINVTMMGKLKNGNDFSETESFTFSKDVKPKAVGITLAGPGLGKTTITVGDW